MTISYKFVKKKKKKSERSGTKIGIVTLSFEYAIITRQV